MENLEDSERTIQMYYFFKSAQLQQNRRVHFKKQLLLLCSFVCTKCNLLFQGHSTLLLQAIEFLKVLKSLNKSLVYW